MIKLSNNINILYPFFIPLILGVGLSNVTAFMSLASDFHSPRTAALGGSGHAGPLLNDAILLNPSFSSFLPIYSLGVNYLNGKNYNFSIQDGRSELFQAGISYSRRADGAFVHVGASKSVVNRIGFGLGGKFFMPVDTKNMVRDLVFSVSGLATRWLQTSFIVDNVLETPEGKKRGLLRDYIVGLKFNVMEIFLIYFDPHYIPSLQNPDRYGYEGGVEFVVMSDLFLRFGNYRNSMTPFQGLRGRGYGAGLGWVAPRLSLDYGISRALEPTIETEHSFGATLYF